MNLTEENTTEKEGLRYQKDEDTGVFYFSIIDAIEVLGLSKDPRNYWKVLKNRLKKGENKLVTFCNQLKMKSSDGKYYLTDVAEADILLEIIEAISPDKVHILRKIFHKIEKANEKICPNNEDGNNEGKKLSTVLYDDGEISIDMYQNKDTISVISLLAGVDPQNIFIGVSCKVLTLKVNRTKQNINDENYHLSELSWGKFSKIISLPYEVDIDKVDTTFDHGLLRINLLILDKEKEKIIKVK